MRTPGARDPAPLPHPLGLRAPRQHPFPRLGHRLAYGCRLFFSRKYHQSRDRKIPSCSSYGQVPGSGRVPVGGGAWGTARPAPPRAAPWELLRKVRQEIWRRQEPLSVAVWNEEPAPGVLRR